MDTEKHVDELEVLFELYSFKASNRKAHYVRPATLAEVMSSDFLIFGGSFSTL
ncbi:MAG: hypothetical protein K2J73_12225 [Oscillospiraceae bacterium]|nr:hypothetical protein [Oscillospiraceae bacterium]